MYSSQHDDRHKECHASGAIFFRGKTRCSFGPEKIALLSGSRLKTRFRLRTQPAPSNNRHLLCALFLLRQIALTSKKPRWSREDTRLLLELKGRQSPNSRVATASRIVSAIGALFSHVHHTACASLAPYQIPKELAKGKEVSVEQIEELEANKRFPPLPHLPPRTPKFSPLTPFPSVAYWVIDRIVIPC